MTSSQWQPLSRARIAELNKEQFEELCVLLLTEEFGKDLQRVEDRLGSGNGLDAVILREAIAGFQIRCYDIQNRTHFGNHHKGGVVESVRKAYEWSRSQNKKLANYVLVCNVDLHLFRSLEHIVSAKTVKQGYIFSQPGFHLFDDFQREEDPSQYLSTTADW